MVPLPAEAIRQNICLLRLQFLAASCLMTKEIKVLFVQDAAGFDHESEPNAD